MANKDASGGTPPLLGGLTKQSSNMGFDSFSGKKGNTSVKPKIPLQRGNSALGFELLKQPPTAIAIDETIQEARPEYEGLILKYAQEGDLKLLKKAIKRSRFEISVPEPGVNHQNYGFRLM